MSSSSSWSKIPYGDEDEASSHHPNQRQHGESSVSTQGIKYILHPYPPRSPATPRGIKGRTIQFNHGNRHQTSDASLESSSMISLDGSSIPGFNIDDGASGNKFTKSVTEMEQQFIDQLPRKKLLEEEEEETDDHLLQQGNIKDRIDIFEGSLPDKFKLEKVLGNGHNGFVFSATEQIGSGQERNIAVKFLSSQRKNHVNRKLREVVAHGFIPKHPHIVQLLSPALSSGAYEYFVMELCDLSLEAWIDQAASLRGMGGASTGALLPPDKPKPALAALDTTRLLFELADAIHALRLLGITHRDIKPSNILLKKNAELESSTEFPFSIKLSDFGVADMQVAETPSTPYDVNLSANLEEKTDKDEFTSEDDFRSAAASVFFAWLAEPRWKDVSFRESLLRDNNEFFYATALFDKNPLDMQVVDLFEHILPTPRNFKANDVYSLDLAISKLKELGRLWGAGNFGLSDMDFDGITQDFEGGLNDAKLDVYVGTALDIVSGRRRDKSRQMAQRFLDRAEYLLGRFKGTPPAYRSCELHFQRSLTLYLPEAQAAVRRFAATMQGGENEQANTNTSRENAGTALDLLNKEIKEGFSFLPESEDGWKGIRRVQFINLKYGLVCLEQVKFHSSCKDFEEARRCADEGIDLLSKALKDIVEQNNRAPSQERQDDYTFNPLFRHKLGSVEPKYQLSRNIYLLMHEKIKIIVSSSKSDDGTFAQLAKDAMNVCERGMDYAMNSLKTSRADKLEMRRCYAEALYVAGEHETAREECKKVVDEFSKDLPSRAIVLRILAIWVATLRQTHKSGNGSLMELGFVCSLLIQRHEDAAKALIGKNAYFVPNAKAFLATDSESAQLAGADPLLPMPLLPEDPYILAQATRVRQSIEEADNAHRQERIQSASESKP